MKGLIGKVTKLKQRDYERAYREGYKAGAEVEKTLKYTIPIVGLFSKNV